MTNFTDADTFGRADGVLANEVDGEIIMMDVDGGKYFVLNPTGGAVWNAIEEPLSFGAICAYVMDRFDVTPEECRASVEQYISELLDKNLVNRI